MLIEIAVALWRQLATMGQDFLIQMLTNRAVGMAKSKTALFNGITGLPAHCFCLSNNYIDQILYTIVPGLLTSFTYLHVLLILPALQHSPSARGPGDIELTYSIKS